MTTEQHRILYNMGSPISCNHSNKLHLCPNENSYKYFVYWSEVRKEDGTKFGNAVDEKKVQLKRQTGEEEAFLGEDIPICQKCMEERRVEMFLAYSCGKDLFGHTYIFVEISSPVQNCHFKDLKYSV